MGRDKQAPKRKTGERGPSTDQKFERVQIASVTPHPRNPRRGDVDAIQDSIRHNGWYGAIVVQRSTRHVIAGNHRLLAAQRAGMTEIDAILIDVDDERARRILLADNRTNDRAGYDKTALIELLRETLDTVGSIDGTGYDKVDLAGLVEEIFPAKTYEDVDGLYTRRIVSPIYEPRDHRPAIADLLDRSKTDVLLTEIQATDLPRELKAFLASAAERHTVFRFDRIADYYANAPVDVQRLMEASVLVIIDFDQAIERGFVRLNETTEQLFKGENPDA